MSAASEGVATATSDERPAIFVTADPDAVLAPWWPRVVAKLIDSVLVWLPFTLLWFLAMGVTDGGDPFLGGMLYSLTIAQGVVGWGWVMRDTGKTGQSWGKRIARTKMLGRRGVPVGFGHAFLHETLSLFVDLLPLFIGYLRPLFTRRKQTFSDAILHTQTLRVPPGSPRHGSDAGRST